MLYFSQFRVLEYLFSQFITRGEIGRRATRSSQMLNFPLFKSASGQRTFYYRIVSIWNSMDSHLKAFESVSAFKFNVKRKLQPRPQGFSLKKWVGIGKSPGDEVA